MCVCVCVCLSVHGCVYSLTSTHMHHSLSILIVHTPVEIEFTTPEVTVVEREGPAEFCVGRTGDIRSEVDITVSTGNITDGRPRAEGNVHVCVFAGVWSIGCVPPSCQCLVCSLKFRSTIKFN